MFFFQVGYIPSFVILQLHQKTLSGVLEDYDKFGDSNLWNIVLKRL